MYIGPEHCTLSKLAAGLHIKPPASSASRGHWLSETALTEGRESLVILVIKIKTFLTFVFCVLNKIYKPWTEVTLHTHNSSVTRLILVIIFMPLWIKDGHLLIARNSIPSQPKGKVLYSLNLWNTNRSIFWVLFQVTCLYSYVYIFCKYKALLIPMPKYWSTVGLLPVKTLALWTEYC